MKQISLALVFIFGILYLCCLAIQLSQKSPNKKLWRVLRTVCLFFMLVFLTVYLLATWIIGL